TFAPKIWGSPPPQVFGTLTGPTFESGAARNFSAAGNNVSSGVKPGNFPQLLSNVNDSPGRANGQESPSEVQFNSNLNPIEKIRPTPAVGLQNARKNF
uniref:Uncharacterized protein n=1 Tax=Romanomermis culicivorax TaxID=13658 RepID=A0A915K2W1_ROMCU